MTHHIKDSDTDKSSSVESGYTPSLESEIMLQINKIENAISVIKATCGGRTPNSPSAPVTTTESTSSE